ncbi:MAG: DAK2 domain-containing protein, partial [Clostridia bacterium]|nr:DAK2 domain-containing protein [Clostridia bacterium]
MQIEKINGDNLKALLYSGAANLTEHKKEVNDLNVFPVPDGDTGTNMEFTMRGAIKGAESAEGDLSDVSKSMAKGSLMGARGNSGVILSQFLKGISIGFQEIRTAGAKELVSAFQTGVKYAYKSVLKPTEGTILTVMREATDYAEAGLTASSTVEGVLTDFLKEAKASLKRTPDLLPVLKKAGVIDSGAQGLIYIVEGFRKCVRGEDDGTYEEVEADFAKGEEEVAIADSAECEKAKYGVVAVCTGDKLSETFTEMGVDRIIR